MGLFSRAEFQLCSDLRQLSHFAIQQNIAILDAYENANSAVVSARAREAFERLGAAGDTLTALPSVDEDRQLSERTVKRLARLAAVSMQAHVSARAQTGRLGPMGEDPAYIERATRRAETLYRALLLDSRTAARSGRIERLVHVLSRSLDAISGDVAYAAIALAGQGDAAKSNAMLAIRIAHVTRRLSMLGAASLLLMFRMTTTAKASGLRQVAENRTQLVRPEAMMRAAVPRVRGSGVGDAIRLQARCVDLEWVDAGDGYSRVVVEAGEITELRLARRNLQRAGLAKGSWLYVPGTVVEEGGARFLEIGRLPITTTARDIWEDYLISETRPAYDLAPGSIDMLWELPDLREIGGPNDLHGRL